MMTTTLLAMRPVAPARAATTPSHLGLSANRRAIAGTTCAIAVPGVAADRADVRDRKAVAHDFSRGIPAWSPPTG